MNVAMRKPDSSEHNLYYGKYIALVGEENPLDALRSGRDLMLRLLGNVSEADSLIKHAPYTWSIKEVIGHLVDSERIFAYRALRIARGDSTPLPGFEENDYVRVAGFDRRPLPELASEFDTVRRSTLSLFESVEEAAWERRGMANGSPISVRALAFILAGHERHHSTIIKARLGVS